jgi:hypothetical protein
MSLEEVVIEKEAYEFHRLHPLIKEAALEFDEDDCHVGTTGGVTR